MMSPNILLTGATGFIGRQFVRQFPVTRCVVRSKNACSCKETFEVSELSAETNWGSAFESIDVIIHLAGLAHSSTYSLEDYKTVNVDGTIKLAKEAAAAGVKRFVFVSSVGVNGSNSDGTVFTPSSKPNPHNDYAWSKLQAELELKKLSETTGMDLVIVRPTLVYGPQAPGNFGLLTKWVGSVPVLPFGMAKNRRHFISVMNLCDLLASCASMPQAAGHVFFAAEFEALSTREFTDAIARGLNKHVWQLPIPVSFMKAGACLIGKSALASQLYGNLEVDSSNLNDVIGWTPPYTLEQSMRYLKATHQ